MIDYREFECETTCRFHVLDITDDVRKTVATSGIVEGTVLVFAPHTTCGVLLSASPEEAVHQIQVLMEKVAPEGLYYAHDDLDIRTENLVENEPPNARSHIAYLFGGSPSESVPIHHGDLALESGERLVLLEFDSPRLRRYCVQVHGE